MRVNPILVNCGRKLPVITKTHKHTSYISNTPTQDDVAVQSVNFKGGLGKIFGGAAGMLAGTAFALATGGAFVPYFVVAGALWGDETEEEIKAEQYNNKKRKK